MNTASVGETGNLFYPSSTPKEDNEARETASNAMVLLPKYDEKFSPPQPSTFCSPKPVVSG